MNKSDAWDSALITEAITAFATGSLDEGRSEAALLAHAGFVSRPDALEADQGLAITHAAEMRNPDEMLDGLGQSWMFEGVLHKYHACCHGVHASLEALIEARDSLGTKPDEIASVSLSVPPRYLKVCNILEPRTGLGAKFSYRLCSAMVFAGWDTAALTTYSDAACLDPDLIALRDRVVVTGLEELGKRKQGHGSRPMMVEVLKSPTTLIAWEGSQCTSRRSRPRLRPCLAKTPHPIFRMPWKPQPPPPSTNGCGARTSLKPAPSKPRHKNLI